MKQLDQRPVCGHLGPSDCFAIDKHYHCMILNETTFKGNLCPFYKSCNEVKKYEEEK